MRGGQDGRWLAVYGATVAAQVREVFDEGHNPTSDADWEYMVEEAEATADAAIEAEERLGTAGA